MNTDFSAAKKIAKRVSGRRFSHSMKKYPIFVLDESTDMNNIISVTVTYFMQQERDLVAGITQTYHKCLCGSSLTPPKTSWILRYVSLRRFH